MSNLFEPPAQPHHTELFEHICQTQAVLIERIVSYGHITPQNEWYNQDRHEWVMLLQGNATLLFDHHNGETINMQAGSHIYIAAHRLHRVIYTSTEPPCIWIAVHFS